MSSIVRFKYIYLWSSESVRENSQWKIGFCWMKQRMLTNLCSFDWNSLLKNVVPLDKLNVNIDWDLDLIQWLIFLSNTARIPIQNLVPK